MNPTLSQESIGGLMLKALTAILIMIVLFFPDHQATADMYKWVDQNGIVHFSDTPPVSGQKIKTIKTPDYPETGPDPTTAKPYVYKKKPLTKPPLRVMPKSRKPKRNYAYRVEIL